MISWLLRLRRPASTAENPAQADRSPPEKSGPDPAPPSASNASLTLSTNRPRPTLVTLPPEIHLLIAQYLIYPDALSLKHTNRHFYRLVDTGVRLKVEWLMERRLLHLECPNDQRCDLGSDLRFCRGSVKLLMRRRREHMECESRPGLGCLIYGTSTCPQARKLKTRVKKWWRGTRARDRTRWMLLLASLVPLFIGWAWMVWVMVFRPGPLPQ
ncbi:e39c7567-572b-4603-b171-c21ad213ae1e [Thermothielavioides terrestris]|uniref:F-box domain-containing protein n=2 Tax=Thermothielavioides terrestris TaxID=2587410 RepID=G2R053_THETT|nr:uncharacterized protein THITE_2114527 [Thermothielavioides terrestris NRRL 8126]AEO66428.1 hypothetical protein THITE_2114527 [Thermothielavioides terrestris NRRL 8126]SPQ25546.1 e39c7567-572b-4603-b171-c21ad213ae1e [Thermothielavioides terrestris]